MGFYPTAGKPGVVYIIKNPAYKDGLYKIGSSTRSAGDRADELYKEAGTGTPGNFEVVFESKTDDCGNAEKEIHKELSERGCHFGKEWFKIEEEDEDELIDLVESKCEDHNEYEAPTTGSFGLSDASFGLSDALFVGALLVGIAICIAVLWWVIKFFYSLVIAFLSWLISALPYLIILAAIVGGIYAVVRVLRHHSSGE